MKRFKKILVATDTRLDHHPIVDEAAEIALHSGASLKIVDVVPEFPWTIRMAMKDHEHMQTLLAEEKRDKLGSLAESIRVKGIAVGTKVLMGKTSVEIIREVLRGGHDLVLRVAKGSASRRSGFFGNTAIRLLRKCPCAVWLVTPGTTPTFKHVLGCVDVSSGDESDGELNDNIYELSSTISEYHGGCFSMIHAWSIWNEPMLKSRMHAEEFENMQQSTRDHIAAQMKRFLNKHGRNPDDENVHLVQDEPAAAISRFVTDRGVDLVVMGTVARSGLSGVVMGNTAEQILNRIDCSVLALKPSSFVSPIHVED